jgi:hypothetical protein
MIPWLQSHSPSNTGPGVQLRPGGRRVFLYECFGQPLWSPRSSGERGVQGILIELCGDQQIGRNKDRHPPSPYHQTPKSVDSLTSLVDSLTSVSPYSSNRPRPQKSKCYLSSSPSFLRLSLSFVSGAFFGRLWSCGGQRGVYWRVLTSCTR